MEEQGQILGVAGVYDEHGTQVAFSHLTDAIRGRKRLLVRGARFMQQALDGLRVIAVASPTEPTSRGLLSSLGFRHIGESVAGGVFVRG